MPTQNQSWYAPKLRVRDTVANTVLGRRFVPATAKCTGSAVPVHVGESRRAARPGRRGTIGRPRLPQPMTRSKAMF
jgi:hypothetical protein